MASEAAVRAAFADQADACRALGSPFTALLMAEAVAGLDRSTALGRRILDWPGEPHAVHDAVPLRFAGGLHALVRGGRLPELATLYPPAALPDGALLWRTVAAAVETHGAVLDAWLNSAPQTNEVGRSPMLMCGMLAISEATGGLPIALFEMGASSGLNLAMDRYGYRLGDIEAGVQTSPLHFTPAWTGPSPPVAPVRFVSRRGVDLNPLDLTQDADRNRVTAYIWPDHHRRLALIEAAIPIVAADPPPIDRSDAADWIETRLAPAATPGVTRVLMNSIAFQYFPESSKRRIVAHMDAVGAAATDATPLAWLRFELDAALGAPALRLKLWPGGEDRLLATGSAQAPQIDWIG